MTNIDEQLTGWVGDGCSPLQHGFPSACGCTDDAHCANGETCSASRCVNIDGDEFSCVCGANNACHNGRICHDGACVAPCAVDDDCAPGRVCDGGACVPPHGIPTAEEAWGMDNVMAPIHAVSTYAMSVITFIARFSASFYVEASFKLFGRTKTWRILDLARIWDIGSTSKAWYQPGLEARYEHECAPGNAGAGMTNYFPISPTSPPASLANAGAGNHPNCAFLSGGVCATPIIPPPLGTVCHRSFKTQMRLTRQMLALWRTLSLGVKTICRLNSRIRRRIPRTISPQAWWTH